MDVRTLASAPDPAGDGDEPRTASLTFEGDGQVFGTGGVNRLRGTWSVDGDTLTFGPVVSTLMAGPPAAMHQESELLRLLQEPLELRAPDGTPVTALEPLAAPPGAAGDVARVELGARTGERLALTRAG